MATRGSLGTMAQELKAGPPIDHLISLPPNMISIVGEHAFSYFLLGGFSGCEQAGRWSDGPRLTVTFMLPFGVEKDILIKIKAGAFAATQPVPYQSVHVSVNGHDVANWRVDDPTVRTRAIFVNREILSRDCIVTMDFDIPTCAQPSAHGINGDTRSLGIFLTAVSWEVADGKPLPEALVWQLGRCVGAESRKSFDDKIEAGFWDRYVTGPKVLDIGFKGGGSRAFGVVPIVETAIGVDLDYPGYDGRILPFGSDTQDAVYSSHCLEHIADFIGAIQEWFRVIKVGGYIIAVVPSMYLYERRRRPPSRRNASHMRFYTPASLLAEFELALCPDSYRVRHLMENDAGYRYEAAAELPPAGCYEIELVIEKISPPSWQLEQ
jgi:SAM-dependent methyltransferase